MKKLAVIIALPLISAGNAFAGDFTAAADAGYNAHGILPLVAFIVLVVGTTIFLWKYHRQAKLPVISATTVAATVVALHAGDFANAADRGFGLDRRSAAVVSGVNALGRGNEWMSTHQLEALNFVYHFSSNSSTPRETAGALLGGLESAGSAGGRDVLFTMPGTYNGVASGALGGPAGNFRWGTTLCTY